MEKLFTRPSAADDTSAATSAIAVTQVVPFAVTQVVPFAYKTGSGDSNMDAAGTDVISLGVLFVNFSVRYSHVLCCTGKSLASEDTRGGVQKRAPRWQESRQSRTGASSFSKLNLLLQVAAALFEVVLVRVIPGRQIGRTVNALALELLLRLLLLIHTYFQSHRRNKRQDGEKERVKARARVSKSLGEERQRERERERESARASEIACQKASASVCVRERARVCACVRVFCVCVCVRERVSE